VLSSLALCCLVLCNPNPNPKMDFSNPYPARHFSNPYP
jgi:hypothetical protein